MRIPSLIDSPDVWEKYLRQCNQAEIDEMVRAVGTIGDILKKLIVEDLSK